MTEASMAPAADEPTAARRGPGRPPVRGVSEKVEGTRSATAVRRRRMHTLNQDRFHIPDELKNPAMTYEWKRHTVIGQEQPFHLQEQRQQGWEACQFEDFPGYAPPDMKGQFVRDGQMLMMRPKELTEEYNDELRQANMSVIADRMAALGQTPQGELPRDHASARKVSGIKQSWERPAMRIEE